MPFGSSHRFLVQIASWALYNFFSEIQVVNEDNVPKTGPVIVACTHHNMSVDPAVLSTVFPHRRLLHYWAKASLFANPVANAILLNSGNIPVARKSGDNQKLMKPTFEVLALGETVAVFPEGTSYTEPRIMQVKDGIAWTALEYTKWLRGDEGRKSGGKDVVVVPVSIVYTNKSKYRSSVVVEFAQPITMEAYEKDFLSGHEGTEKLTAKKLTQAIEAEMVRLTVNAVDWETLYAGKMARELLWENNNDIKLDEFTAVYQTLVDLFSSPNPASNYADVKKDLLTYQSLLATTHLTNGALSDLPLPSELDPTKPSSFPSRFRTLMVLVKDSLACLVRLPFFIFPLLIHLPTYAVARYGARLAEDEEESQAQNKIVFGLLLVLLIYPAMFFALWTLFWLTPVGALIALGTVVTIAMYYVRIVDDNYRAMKRLVAAWRVLLGVWAPRKWDMSVTALSPYTTIQPPPPNPWIDRPKTPTPTPESEAPPAPRIKRKRPASRRLIRHVLRARLNAAHSLVAFLNEIDKAGVKVRSASHLALAHGGGIDGGHGPNPEDGPQGWRYGKEVVEFLRKRGAKIHRLKEPTAGDWAANTSDEEAEELLDVKGGVHSDTDAK